MGLLLGSGNTKPQYPYDQWYGVQGDFNSQDYKLKRVGNLDLHRTLPIQAKLKRFVENPDGSVKYYLNQNDSRKKDSGATALIDSTDGNVMLEKPEYYFKLEIDGTKDGKPVVCNGGYYQLCSRFGMLAHLEWR